MTVHQELAAAAPPRDCVLTLGVFDGVHLGHQRLLSRLVEEGRRRDLLAGVLTFRNHPRAVLTPGAPLALLSSFPEREALLRAAGVDFVAAVTFTPELSRLPARQFATLLVEHLRVRGMVVGPDFAMGHRREGTVPVVRELGRELGFTVEAVEPLTLDGMVVSSSAIRRAVLQGEVEVAARMLGRPYPLPGRVVRGAGRGRGLGFPTANLEVEAGRAVPGDGIYATWALVEGRRFPAATSVGVRPTFGGGARAVEAHLLDFHGELYGTTVTLEFVARLREERRFESPQALAAQMERDVAQAGALLAQRPVPAAGRRAT